MLNPWGMTVLGGIVRGSVSFWWVDFEDSDAQTRPVVAVSFLLSADPDAKLCLCATMLPTVAIMD